MAGDSLALNIGVNAAARPSGRAIAVFNTEMPRRAFYTHLLGILGEIDTCRLTYGGLNDAECTYSSENVAGRLAISRIFLNAAPIQRTDVLESIRLHRHSNAMERAQCSCGELMGPLSVYDIGNMLRRLQRDHELDLVVVDDLQLVCHGNQTKNCEQSLAESARALKALAVELQVPIIAVSQITVDVEHRRDRRPKLGDLLWSDGTAEQAADMVLMVHRNGLYELDFSGPLWARADETAEILIAKHPDGVTGTVNLPFYEPYQKFGKCLRPIIV